MPSEPGGAPPSETPESKRPWVENPKLKLVAAVVGIVATAVTAVVGVRGLLNTTPAVAPATTLASSVTTPMSLTTSGPIPESTDSRSDTAANSGIEANAVVVGDCMTTDGAVVPCTATHHFEVIGLATDACDLSVATSYLGGESAVDVPRLVVESKFGVCVVSSADQDVWFAPVRESFAAGGDSPYWSELRRCIDDHLSQGRDVSCAVKHTGEYVGTASGLFPDEGQCMDAAQSYLGTGLGQGDKQQLTVVTMVGNGTTSSGPYCLVSVRGNNVLTASVRNIRTRALPLSPP